MESLRCGFKLPTQAIFGCDHGCFPDRNKATIAKRDGFELITLWKWASPGPLIQRIGPHTTGWEKHQPPERGECRCQYAGTQNRIPGDERCSDPLHKSSFVLEPVPTPIIT